MKLLCKDASVPCRLIEHQDKVAVLKDVLDLLRSQQVLDVLGNTAGYAAPFPEPFPDLHGIGGGLFRFQ